MADFLNHSLSSPPTFSDSSSFPSCPKEPPTDFLAAVLADLLEHSGRLNRDAGSQKQCSTLRPRSIAPDVRGSLCEAVAECGRRERAKTEPGLAFLERERASEKHFCRNDTESEIIQIRSPSEKPIVAAKRDRLFRPLIRAKQKTRTW
jgi:hypothetical protein